MIFPSDGGYQSISHQFAMVSPMNDAYYPQTNKLNLEDYTYLSTLFKTGFIQGWFVMNASPTTFHVVDQLDFGTINLEYHTKDTDTFQLRSKVTIHNVTKKTIVVAPYYGSSIHFDKLSYRVPPLGEIEILFSCDVVLSELDGPIKRTIKFEDYSTKYSKLFTFTADFIRETEGD